MLRLETFGMTLVNTGSYNSVNILMARDQSFVLAVEFCPFSWNLHVFTDFCKIGYWLVITWI